MKKAIAALSLVIIFVLYVAVTSIIDNRKLQQHNNRLRADITALNSQLTQYTDKQGREISEIAALELTVNELKNSFPQVIATLQELKIKPKQINSITQVSSQQQKEIITPVKDTIIIQYNDTSTARAFRYRDPFYTVNGLIFTDTAHLKINSIDTLTQIVYRERVKPWLLFFSRTKLVQLIRTSNPANHVIYSRYIEIKK